MVAGLPPHSPRVHAGVECLLLAAVLIHLRGTSAACGCAHLTQQRPLLWHATHPPACVCFGQNSLKGRSAGGQSCCRHHRCRDRWGWWRVRPVGGWGRCFEAWLGCVQVCGSPRRTRFLKKKVAWVQLLSCCACVQAPRPSHPPPSAPCVGKRSGACSACWSPAGALKMRQGGCKCLHEGAMGLRGKSEAGRGSKAPVQPSWAVILPG